ncbi:MAG: type III-B CRISPR module RAMP protein Cmr6 [Chthonomonadales bacterium]|nr:type III-B CRISPR module RAMP protein Cmr6 [Chthonomonadales bacterium]
MSTACRTALSDLPREECGHAGLLTQRYLVAHKEMEQERNERAPKPEEELLQAAAGVAAGPAYRAALERWKGLAAERGWLTLAATTAGPLAVGLGGETPLEVGLAIHHTYGMPVIPGSAIKGLCRRAAARAGVASGTPPFVALFGDTEQQARIAYLDTWYDPGPGEGKPFHRDVITVHHRDYYRARGKGVWPTDFDDPTPVPFLVVAPETRFLFTLECPSEAWALYARNLLTWALENLGAGGKTNAGYGRFRVERPPAAPPPPDRWPATEVRRDPGSGELRASFQGRTAHAHGKRAQELFEKLPEPARQALKGKKKVARLVVEVTGGGKVWEIVSLYTEEE